MKRAIIKWGGFQVTKREIFSDLIFLSISGIISLLAVVIFNIHWSFYPGNTLFPPSKTVGIGWEIYVIGTLAGAVIGFFIIKLFLIGVKEEEIEWLHSKGRK